MIHQSAVDQPDSLVDHASSSIEDDDNDIVSPFLLNNPAHIRSFSDGFYSLDRSSLSSDCSELSNEKRDQNHDPTDSIVSTQPTSLLSVNELNDANIAMNGDTLHSLTNGHFEDEINPKIHRTLYQAKLIAEKLNDSGPAAEDSIDKTLLNTDFDSDCSECEIIRIITRL